MVDLEPGGGRGRGSGENNSAILQEVTSISPQFGDVQQMSSLSAAAAAGSAAMSSSPTSTGSTRGLSGNKYNRPISSDNQENLHIPSFEAQNNETVFSDKMGKQSTRGNKSGEERLQDKADTKESRKGSF